jgi:hypothetical protein
MRVEDREISLSDQSLRPSIGAPETRLEQSVRELKTLTNRQVELFDRLEDLETRFDALSDRVSKGEDRVARLGGRKPVGLR